MSLDDISLELAGLITCGVVMLIALVATVVDSEKKLPRPRDDDRNWSDNYMKDYKRWTR